MITQRSKLLPVGENKHGGQFGHLRLLTSDTDKVGRQTSERPIDARRKEGRLTAIVTSEKYMPKRGHQDNRKYKIDDSNVEVAARPESGTTPSIKREFMLTPSADDTLFRAVRILSRATGTNLSNSHFLRVMLKVIAEAIPQIEKEASLLGKLKRPGNSAANQPEREDYEQRLAGAVAAAIAAARRADTK
ncbi:MAG: hypothetical protein IRY99_12270 [Isosphaeraceae bacterium]|nr:hypothetical protein [Isosphaeraceae bacterium]